MHYKETLKVNMQVLLVRGLTLSCKEVDTLYEHKILVHFNTVRHSSQHIKLTVICLSQQATL